LKDNIWTDMKEKMKWGNEKEKWGPGNPHPNDPNQPGGPRKKKSWWDKLGGSKIGKATQSWGKKAADAAAAIANASAFKNKKAAGLFSKFKKNIGADLVKNLAKGQGQETRRLQYEQELTAALAAPPALKSASGWRQLSMKTEDEAAKAAMKAAADARDRAQASIKDPFGKWFGKKKSGGAGAWGRKAASPELLEGGEPAQIINDANGKPQEPEGGWKAWHEAKKAQFDATNPMAGGATKEDLWDLAKGKAFKKPKGGWFSKIKQQMKDHVAKNLASAKIHAEV